MSNYEINKPHPFHEFAHDLSTYEIRPGNTVTFVSEVDLTEINTIRKKRVGIDRPSYTAILIKAAALALKENPSANQRLFRNPYIPFSPFKLQKFNTCTITVAAEKTDIRGEKVPVASHVGIIRKSEDLMLAEINQELRNLANSNEENDENWKT